MTRTLSPATASTPAERSNVRTVAAIALVLLAVGFAYWQLRGPSAASQIGQTFFSVDDGKTWFADDMSRLPPFDKDGKPAVRAYVFRGTDGKEAVGYLQRFTPEACRTIETSRRPDPSRKGPVDPTLLRNAFTTGREVKRPGDAAWVSGADPQKADRLVAEATSGGTATAVEP